MDKRNAWECYEENELKKVEEVNTSYRAYLDAGKTERECVTEAVRQARLKGYRDLYEIVKNGETLKAGDKVYAVCMEKAVVLYQIGTRPMEEGLNILGAHIDSPRIDIKPVPLYEEEGYAYLDTHYYGGIKKYQWLAMPLAIHGIVVKEDGTSVSIVIGEKEEEPVLVITDILPHLDGVMREKKAKEFVNAEKMDLLIGNKPLKGKKENAVKERIAELLKDRYGLNEEDFLSAELEIVPAGKARNCGMDNSMILAYGQDDRVCAYTSLYALLETGETDRTACCLLVDKEETGSIGATGMKSRFFENTLAELMSCTGEYTEIGLRRALARSKMLSSDVSAAYDPMYTECYEKKNSAYLSRGLVFNKYTGVGGKSGSSEAAAEYVAEIRRIMNRNQVVFQTAELGAIDIGGGGTIAYLMAEYGMHVIDSGIAVMSMHAPWEVTSKADIYEAVKGYSAFLKEA